MKINNQKEQTKPFTIPLEERKTTFKEVELTYTLDMAENEAARCLQCKHKPCVESCPVHIDIPGFIKHIVNKELDKSFDVLYSYNQLPAVCGRVCPQEIQCQSTCVRGIKGEPVSIGRLERFVADWARGVNYTADKGIVIKKNIKVAVIGSGPAGLSAAGELNRLGYDVTVFEALNVLGGVLVYGIPEFRLPNEIVEYEIEKLKNRGVKFETNVVVGKTITYQDMLDEGFKAFFIGSGAGLPRFLNIEGENLNSVYTANEFLTRINLFKEYQKKDSTLYIGKRVAVIGGGNVAMDAARSALRMGAEVHIIYRRTEAEMPARKEEIIHAKEEGVIFNFLVNPVKFIGDENNYLKEIELVKMELGEPDSSGRRRPKVVENSNFRMEFDSAIIAIGQIPNPVIKNFLPDIELTKHNTIKIDENYMTNITGVFAGGDIVSGAATVILAMGAGKNAAKAIDRYLNEKRG